MQTGCRRVVAGRVPRDNGGRRIVVGCALFVCGGARDGWCCQRLRERLFSKLNEDDKVDYGACATSKRLCVGVGQREVELRKEVGGGCFFPSWKLVVNWENREAKLYWSREDERDGSPFSVGLWLDGINLARLLQRKISLCLQNAAGEKYPVLMDGLHLRSLNERLVLAK